MKTYFAFVGLLMTMASHSVSANECVPIGTFPVGIKGTDAVDGCTTSLKLKLGKTCKLECKPGYIAVGNGIYTCLKNGKQPDTDFFCKENTCTVNFKVGMTSYGSDGCDRASQCQSFCSKNTASWSSKCMWKKCNGCTQCRATPLLIHVGTSLGSNSKILSTGINGIVCPSSIALKNKQIFTVSVDGTKVTVTRIDSAGGWGNVLKVPCIRSASGADCFSEGYYATTPSDDPNVNNIMEKSFGTVPTDNVVDTLTSIPTATACQRKCQDDAKCLVWSFEQASNKCYLQFLHAGGGLVTPSKTFISGPKYCAGAYTYDVGPRVNNAISNSCQGFKGTLQEAQQLCDADSSCGWLHDANCDGTGWRVCGAMAWRPSGDKKACTLNKKISGLPPDGQIFHFQASGTGLEDRAGDHIIRLVSGKLNAGYSTTHGLGGIPVPYVEGTADTVINWGVPLPEKFTICTLARYSGSNQGRIFSVADKNGKPNWLHSHYAGKAGVAFYQKWLTSQEVSDTHTPNTDWVAVCGENSPPGEGVQQVLVNGQNKLVATGGTVLGTDPMTTNLGGKETSDFQISRIVIWNRALSLEEMKRADKFMRQIADTLSSVSDNRCGVQCNEAAGYTSTGKSKFAFFDCPLAGGDATTGLSCQGKQCATPPTIPNARAGFPTNGGKFPSSLAFTCDNGYEQGDNSSMQMQCSQDGLWEGNVSCIGIRCADAPDFPNAVAGIPSNGGRYPSTIEYTCETGFSQASGSVNKIKCGISDGKWSGSITCTGVQCPAIPSVPHSTHSSLTNWGRYPDSVRYTCNAGYEHATEDTKKCTSKGEWSNAVECVGVPCDAAPTVPNAIGKTATNNAKYPSNINYDCQRGYIHSGKQAFKSCAADRKWTGAVQCTGIKCLAPPVVDNAESKSPSNSGRFPSTVIYTCAGGYELENTKRNSNHCHADGGWSEDVRCRGIVCKPPPSVPHAVVSSPSATRRYPSEVTYTCKNGYKPADSRTSKTCNKDGTWSGDVECVEKTCQVVLGKHMVADGTNGCSATKGDKIFLSTVSNNKCDVKCDGTTGKSDKGSFFCGIEGNAASTALDCLKDKCFGITCGGDSKCIAKDDNFFCTCAPGWKSGGLGKVCKGVQCAAIPLVFHSTHDVPSHKGRFPSIVKYRCNPGYTLAGHDRKECTSEGTWSNAVVCVGIMCQPPPKVANAEMSSPRNGGRFPSTVTYTCKSGFELTRSLSGTNICRTDGRWTELVQCERVTCKPPPTVAHASKDLSSKIPVKYPYTVTYTCNVGFKPVGSKKKFCQTNGSWLGDVRCEKIVVCKPPVGWFVSDKKECKLSKCNVAVGFYLIGAGDVTADSCKTKQCTKAPVGTYYISSGDTADNCAYQRCTNAGEKQVYTGNHRNANECPVDDCSSCPDDWYLSDCGGIMKGTCVKCSEATSSEPGCQAPPIVSVKHQEEEPDPLFFALSKQPLYGFFEYLLIISGTIGLSLIIIALLTCVVCFCVCMVREQALPHDRAPVAYEDVEFDIVDLRKPDESICSDRRSGMSAERFSKGHDRFSFSDASAFSAKAETPRSHHRDFSRHSHFSRQSHRSRHSRSHTHHHPPRSQYSQALQRSPTSHRSLHSPRSLQRAPTSHRSLQSSRSLQRAPTSHRSLHSARSHQSLHSPRSHQSLHSPRSYQSLQRSPTSRRSHHSARHLRKLVVPTSLTHESSLPGPPLHFQQLNHESSPSPSSHNSPPHHLQQLHHESSSPSPSGRSSPPHQFQQLHHESSSPSRSGHNNFQQLNHESSSPSRSGHNNFQQLNHESSSPSRSGHNNFQQLNHESSSPSPSSRNSPPHHLQQRSNHSFGFVTHDHGGPGGHHFFPDTPPSPPPSQRLSPDQQSYATKYSSNDQSYGVSPVPQSTNGAHAAAAHDPRRSPPFYTTPIQIHHNETSESRNNVVVDDDEY